MGIQSFPDQGSQSYLQPFGSSGTFNLLKPLTPGLYKITADTTQNFSTAQLYFATSGGQRFGAAVKGGLGYISVPSTFSTITLTSGTFPLVLGFEIVAGYQLFPAPSNVVVEYTALTSPWTYTVTYSLASGGTGLVAYYANGTSQDLGSSTTTANGTFPTKPEFNEAYPVVFAAKDANGVVGYGVENTSLMPYAIFTTSGTYTKPTWSNTADILVAGGGGGSGNFVPNNGWGGGGGGGGAEFQPSVSINAPFSVTIGAGGPRGSAGGQTSVLNYTQNGGGSGGGGTGPSSGGTGGTSGNGFGGGGGGTFTSGGGGGATGAGGSAGPPSPDVRAGNAGTGLIAPSNIKGVRVSGGGVGATPEPGGPRSGTAWPSSYGGGGAQNGGGQSGVVIVYAK